MQLVRRAFPDGLVVKESALSLLRWRFNPWPGNFRMLQTQPKKKKILLHPGHHLFLPGFCCTILIEFFYSYPASPESVLCSAARAMFLKGNVIMLLMITPIFFLCISQGKRTSKPDLDTDACRDLCCTLMKTGPTVSVRLSCQPTTFCC